MTDPKPYNPLDKMALANSIAQALLSDNNPPQPMPALTAIGAAVRSESFIGAGVYCIYYLGEKKPFAAYEPIAEQNRGNRFQQPIYVGKAVPKGARKGLGFDAAAGTVLYDRLVDHARSILRASSTLALEDFRVRFLRVDDIWIPLGEALLIDRFQPAWNKVVEGYGNHDPGKGRKGQQRSLWDTVHPGRKWAEKLAENSRSAAWILENLTHFLKGEPAEVIEESDDGQPVLAVDL